MMMYIVFFRVASLGSSMHGWTSRGHAAAYAICGSYIHTPYYLLLRVRTIYRTIGGLQIAGCYLIHAGPKLAIVSRFNNF